MKKERKKEKKKGKKYGRNKERMEGKRKKPKHSHLAKLQRKFCDHNAYTVPPINQNDVC